MHSQRARFYRRKQKSCGKDYGYVAEFVDHSRKPKKKRISLKTKDWAVARQKFDKWEKAQVEGKWDPWNDTPPEEGVTVRVALKRFLDHCREKGLAQGSIATYDSVIGSFAKYLPATYPLYGVQSSDVDAWLEDKERADTTKRSYRERVRIFFQWCLDENLVRANPIPPVKAHGKKGREKKLPRFLTEEEEARLFAAMKADAVLKPEIEGGNRWLLDICRFALGTGLRRGELINLRWTDLNLDMRFVHVRNRDGWTTKSGRERVVPLAGEALQVAKDLAALRVTEDPEAHVFTGVGGDPVNKDYLSKRFAFYRDLAKLPKAVSFHGLRHTYATRLLKAGSSTYKVKELMGHANVGTTQQYAHLTGFDLRADVEQAFGVARAEESDLAAENAKLKAQLAAIRELGDQLAAGAP